MVPMSSEPLYREVQRGYLFTKLSTEVKQDGLYVQMGPLQWYPRRIPFETITDVSVTTYSASEFGGWAWGVRVGPSMKSKAYRVRGNRGVWISRRGAKDLFLGSQSPEELAAAIRRAKNGA